MTVLIVITLIVSIAGLLLALLALKKKNVVEIHTKEQILPIGDNKVLWDEDKKCYYIDGDLYVKGGISAYTNINIKKQ